MAIRASSKPRIVKAPRGSRMTCKDWPQEAALRMLMNNLDPEVAEKPSELIVYGGSGKAARSWECFEAIVRSLRSLENDETLLVQSGKPVGVLRTQEMAPRVLISNAMLVPAWSTWEAFRELERAGLTMYGQMTAGSWIYIGSQGILQGTYETLAEVARQHFEGSLRGRLVLTAGLGGMGGAQPLAVTMNDGIALVAEVDRQRIKRRLDTGYLDVATDNVDEALRLVEEARSRQRSLSVGVHANAADLFSELFARRAIPDVVTDQTSAHDLLNGYVPTGIAYEDALTLRHQEPTRYVAMAQETVKKHVGAMLDLRSAGAIVFDYGNNIRRQAFDAGCTRAFDFPGFVVSYIRPLFCQGKGPFRWVALSGDPRDIYRTDEAAAKLFADNVQLGRWLALARGRVKFQGLPARICWLGYGERAKFGLLINEMVRKGELRAPIVIGRDHLDAGSVASPYRETEGMADHSDAIADWPILNALVNTASGASWVSVHNGGGVGIGYSTHAGVVIVADGTSKADQRLDLVLTSDPGVGVMRHVDAGYDLAKETARKGGLKIPMLESASGES